MPNAVACAVTAGNERSTREDAIEPDVGDVVGEWGATRITATEDAWNLFLRERQRSPRSSDVDDVDVGGAAALIISCDDGGNEPPSAGSLPACGSGRGTFAAGYVAGHAAAKAEL
jgi:hypothetical protein